MVSEFQERVYAKLKKVPRGKVTTYRDLAHAVGINSSQAIGQAMRHNPFAPDVPCHRVVKSDGTIGGFSGHTKGRAITRKIRLLDDEGVVVLGNSVRDFQECRHRF